MNRLSTHVLDTSTGKPAADITVRIFDAEREIASAVTDKDGRCSPMLPFGKALAPGIYKMLFEIGAHFKEGFYSDVMVAFIVRDASANYHIPLLISPYGFTTYRGS